MFSAIGGLFGTAVLIVAAPALAEFALKFSSFEYFWLVLLGLTCAVVHRHRPAAEGRGLAAPRPARRRASASTTRPASRASPSATPSCSAASALIPMMIGMFAVSEIIRYVVDIDSRRR